MGSALLGRAALRKGSTGVSSQHTSVSNAYSSFLISLDRSMLTPHSLCTALHLPTAQAGKKRGEREERREKKEKRKKGTRERRERRGKERREKKGGEVYKGWIKPSPTPHPQPAGE